MRLEMEQKRAKREEIRRIEQENEQNLLMQAQENADFSANGANSGVEKTKKHRKAVDRTPTDGFFILFLSCFLQFLFIYSLSI